MKKGQQPDLSRIPDSSLQLRLENVPVDGALGLLAYGDIGLVAWRKKRVEVEGPEWRKKLAEEIRGKEEALKESTAAKKPDEHK